MQDVDDDEEYRPRATDHLVEPFFSGLGHDGEPAEEGASPERAAPPDPAESGSTAANGPSAASPRRPRIGCGAGAALALALVLTGAAYAAASLAPLG
ncbi:MAG: hypothetical protein AAF682_22350 [Planctomycetota bacterium]